MSTYSLPHGYDDWKCASHFRKVYLGCCDVCGHEQYGSRRRSTDEPIPLKDWQCPTCGAWGCEFCEDVGKAHTCECGKLFCSGCIERIDGLWLCPECKVQHLQELEGIFSPEIEQAAAVAWACDRIYDTRRAA